MKLMNIWVMSVISVMIKNVDCDNESLTLDGETDITEVSETTVSTTEFHQLVTTELTEIVTQSTTVTPPTPQYWLTKTGTINNDLINIQAIIVKDEDAEIPCNKGERKSEKRYLMCAGSILNEKHVLTSASCLHEALHIRHNIRAPLAVAIAPLKSTVQIIRISEYRIHPKHNTNPYSTDYAKHNIAILSLACGIDTENYHRIELPNKPMTSLCSSDNCMVAIYRIVGYTANVLSQIPAPNVPLTLRKRRGDDGEYRFKRYTDGSRFCAQTGTAVMLNNTQAAIVSVSCDDRKSNTKWTYTDLYTNQDWIHSILHDWNNTNTDPVKDPRTDSHPFNSSSGLPPKHCENCIFNFYISIGCKGRENCRNKSLNTTNAQLRNVGIQWEKNPRKQNSPCLNTSSVCLSDIKKGDDNNATNRSFEALPRMRNTGKFDPEGRRGIKKIYPQPRNLMDKHLQGKMINWQRKQNNQLINQGLRKRIKRGSNLGFITKEFDDTDDKIMKMHALIVRDEETSFCCETAKQVSDHRYFMCSGAILTLKHAITTASCMHFSDIYEHHVDTDLALMIGATTSNPYVIKINRYEMHPNYVFDVDAKDHSTHNLAILFLACSIKPEVAIIPKLPKGVNDDIGHRCCSRNCSVVTIIQSYDNHQVAKLLKAKYIPSPKHEEDNDFEDVSPLSQKTIFKTPNIYPSIREKRSSKLAPAPLLFVKLSSISSKSRNDSWNSSKRRRKTKINIESPSDNRSRNANIIAKILTDRIFRRVSGRRSLSNSSIDEAIASVDWHNVEEAMEQKISTINKSVIDQFVESVIKETMKRIMAVLGGHGTSPLGGESGDKSSFFGTLLGHSSGNRSIDDFSQALTKIITNLMPPNDGKGLAVSSDLSIDERDVGKPPAKYVECPPLGTPVLIDETLIGMVAYTCDDIQNWVEWKYVSISSNMVWLRKRINASQHQSLTICDDASSNRDSLHNQTAAKTDLIDTRFLVNEYNTRNDYRLFNGYKQRN